MSDAYTPHLGPMGRDPMSALDLRHYSAESFELDRTRRYEQRNTHKPTGLWFSVAGDDDWPAWSEREGFRVETLGVEHRARLALDANVLVLRGAAMLDDFTREHCPDQSDLYRVDWLAVANRYDGIVIAPYVWARRLSLSWYYGWDCASGCIWNLNAIESFEPALLESSR